MSRVFNASRLALAHTQVRTVVCSRTAARRGTPRIRGSRPRGDCNPDQCERVRWTTAGAVHTPVGDLFARYDGGVRAALVIVAIAACDAAAPTTPPAQDVPVLAPTA